MKKSIFKLRDSILSFYKDLDGIYLVTSFIGAILIIIALGVYCFEDNFWGYCFALLPVTVWIGICSYVMNYFAKKRIIRNNDKLENCKAVEYVTVYEGLLKENPTLKKNVFFLIYLAIGYKALGEWRTVKAILSHYQLSSPQYWMDMYYYQILSVCYIYENETEQAQGALDELKKLLTAPKVKDNIRKYYLNNVKFIETVLKIRVNDYDGAEAYFSHVLENQHTLFGKTRANFYLAMVYQHEANAEKANECLAYVTEHGGDTLYARLAKKGMDCLAAGDWTTPEPSPQLLPLPKTPEWLCHLPLWSFVALVGGGVAFLFYMVILRGIRQDRLSFTPREQAFNTSQIGIAPNRISNEYEIRYDKDFIGYNGVVDDTVCLSIFYVGQVAYTNDKGSLIKVADCVGDENSLVTSAIKSTSSTLIISNRDSDKNNKWFVPHVNYIDVSSLPSKSINSVYFSLYQGKIIKRARMNRMNIFIVSGIPCISINGSKQSSLEFCITPLEQLSYLFFYENSRKELYIGCIAPAIDSPDYSHLQDNIQIPTKPLSEIWADSLFTR